MFITTLGRTKSILVHMSFHRVERRISYVHPMK
jgi:hypothetical protein